MLQGNGKGGRFQLADGRERQGVDLRDLETRKARGAAAYPPTKETVKRPTWPAT